VPDETALATAEITLVVQVDGRLRERLTVSPGLDEATAVRLALASPKVAAQVDGKTIRRTVYRADRLLNFVVSRET